VDHSDAPEPSGWRWAPAIIAVLCVFAYLALIPVGVVDKDNRLGAAEAILAGALVAGAFFAAQTSYTIKGLKLGSSGLEADFERIEARQDKLENEIRILQVALSGIVNKYEVTHLEKLAADGPATMHYGEIMFEQIKRLDSMDFVRPTQAMRGFNAIADDHGSGLDEFDLKSYVEITEQGREYLALRASLAERAARRRVAA